MVKKENSKQIGKGVFLLVILVVVIGTALFTTVKGLWIYPDVAKDVVYKSFSNGEPYPPLNGMIDHENGWIVISANASDIEDGLIKLRKSYNNLSKKLTTKKVDKIMVAVYEYSGIDWGMMDPYKTGELLFTSNIWMEDIKDTDWTNIETYDEFKKRANIQ